MLFLQHQGLGYCPKKLLRSDGFILQDYKEFVDAENLMSLATSDLRQPVCMEMRAMEIEAMNEKAANLFFQSYVEENAVVPARTNGGDLASMDSSDTFATCTTFPSNSQVRTDPIDRVIGSPL